MLVFEVELLDFTPSGAVEGGGAQPGPGHEGHGH
jgi:hypothetical protein